MKRRNEKNVPSFILLDDDAWALAFSKEIIGSYSRSAETITFTAAEDVIRYIGTEEFISRRKDTIFLTDLHMPGTDGFELLERMESRFNSMLAWFHVFVLSAAACPEEIHRVSAYPCVLGFFYKPFSRDKLEEMLTRIGYPY